MNSKLSKSISLVLLDRDGVINYDSPDYILNPEQWQPIPGSLEAVARLKQAGIKVAICSNQSALGRKMIDRAMFDAIQQRMVSATEEAGGSFDYIAFCPHGPDDGCGCRKPKPGMLNETMDAIGEGIPKDQIVMIGDSLRDIEAADAAGIQGMLVASGYGDAEAALAKAKLFMPEIKLYANLAEAVDKLLENKQ